MTDAFAAALAADLARDEGFVPHAYQDSEGYWTIGIGTLIDKRAGGGITREEAEILLRNRLSAYAAELDRTLPWWRSLDDNRRRALLNMAYNMGVPRLLGFRKMLAALRAGDWPEAARQALDSRWADQVGQRAQRIANVFERG